MSTIMGRKKEPLSIENINEILRGSYGVEVRECQGGTARVSHFLNPERQWWVDVSSLFREDEVPTKQEVSKRLNKQIPERKAYIGARCI